MECRVPHPEYPHLVCCDLWRRHPGLHHADVDLPATGGWVGPMLWDDDGNVYYEGLMPGETLTLTRPVAPQSKRFHGPIRRIRRHIDKYAREE